MDTQHWAETSVKKKPCSLSVMQMENLCTALRLNPDADTCFVLSTWHFVLYLIHRPNYSGHFTYHISFLFSNTGSLLGCSPADSHSLGPKHISDHESTLYEIIHRVATSSSSHYWVTCWLFSTLIDKSFCLENVWKLWKIPITFSQSPSWHLWISLANSPQPKDSQLLSEKTSKYSHITSWNQSTFDILSWNNA